METRASDRIDADGLFLLLDGIVAVAGPLLSPATQGHLRAARERLRANRFNVVVLGEFKRGKSTLLNALLGRDLLPTGVLPLTSAVTLIRYGSDERALVRFRDGREEEHPLRAVASYGTEFTNPANQLGVELILVELCDDLLAAGAQLADTPGVGSIHAHNTEAAEGFLPQVDAALLVLAAEQPLTSEERAFLARAGQYAPPVILVLNKIDQLSAADRDAALQFVRNQTADAAGREYEVFPVSAREGTGVDALRERIATMAERERSDVLFASVGRLARAAAREGAETARFEIHAVQLPLDDLEQRRRRFAERVELLRVMLEEATVLLSGDAERLVKERVDEPLMALARERRERLDDELEAAARDMGAVAPLELGRALEDLIDEKIRKLFSELARDLERQLADELARLERRHADRISAVIDDLGDLVEEVFGSSRRAALPDPELRAPSRFDFKLHEPRQALDHLVGFGRPRLPGSIGRRLVLSDAKDRLAQMADRHAGRLRSDLAGRIRATVQTYDQELRAVVADAIASIEATVERVGEEHAVSEAWSNERLGELQATAERLDSLARELEVGP